MKSITEAISERTSVRNYSERTVEKEKLQQLSEFFRSNTKGPLGSNLKFKIVDASEYDREKLKELGTYGRITGTRLYIAGAVNKNPYAMEDFGYCMEKNILMATSHGLGTCWLGGSVNRSTFGKELEISENEIIPAVTPIGYDESKTSLKNSAISFILRSKKRKKTQEIFFHDNFATPLEIDDFKKYESVLDSVRWAPSAGNLQPWRIVFAENAFHFYLKEISIYNNNSRYQGAKLQNVDIGIAMSHFDLAAAELGLKGKFIASEPSLEKGNLKYIASWQEKNS